MYTIQNNVVKHLLISRIDAIGDVVLTLPVCIYLKLLYPEMVISFLGRTYTKPVVDACLAVDNFIDYDELKHLPEAEQVSFLRDKKIDIIINAFHNSTIAALAKKAGIKLRVGTTSKNSNFFNCNKLVRLSRRNSYLHEAQQVIFLLNALGITHVPSLGTIANYYKDNFKPTIDVPAELAVYLKQDKFNLIIHPKSNGNGREWPLDKFAGLVKLLPKEKFNVIITGSAKEALLFKDWKKDLPDHVLDLSGKMTVEELVTFIYHADGLLASGTGPLHVAAASGIRTLGLFPITRAIDAIRWAPLGRKAEHIESDGDDLSSISVSDVLEVINGWVI